MEIMQTGEINLPKMEENSGKIIVLDIETTGFLESGGKIVEIGMVLLNIKTGKIKPIFDKIICPGPNVKFSNSAWIFQNSDLRIEDVLHAKFLNEYRTEIQNLLNKYPVTAFNKKFDIEFLKANGFKFPKVRHCIMLELTPYTKLPGTTYVYKWPKVEEAWQFLFPDWDYTEAHRAYDDAFHEAKILHEMMKRGYYTFSGMPKMLTDLEQLEYDKYHVSFGMRKKAGSFFKSIGEALGHAHPSNIRIIKKTWPKEWNQYLEIGKNLMNHK